MNKATLPEVLAYECGLRESTQEIEALKAERDRLRDALKDLTYPYEPPETIGDAVLIIDHMRLRATKALE